VLFVMALIFPSGLIIRGSPHAAQTAGDLAGLLHFEFTRYRMRARRSDFVAPSRPVVMRVSAVFGEAVLAAVSAVEEVL
jgi:hypothetical protein